jgi:1-acyl-sn-glycerol-3-phosphate acyltransferase
MHPVILARAAWRGVRFAVVLGAGVVLALGLALRRGPGAEAGRVRLARAWLAAVAGTLDLQLEVRGQPVRGGVLVVANHSSWLDALALGSVYGPGFVAKAEVAAWPVIGWLATRAGTLFLRRGTASSTAAVAEHMAWRLRRGQAVILFPEGTTRPGPWPGEFRARLFRAAVLVVAPVQPVALQYAAASGGPAPAAPFVGDQTFVAHLARLLLAPPIRVRVEILPCLRPGAGQDSRTLAMQAQLAVTLAVEAAQSACPGPSGCNRTVTIAT